MDITCMYMLSYACKIAKKRGVVSAVLGCGWGPLKQEPYINCALEILSLCDLKILRDTVSANSMRAFKDIQGVYPLIDPAVFAALFYRECFAEKDTCEPYIAINFRDMQYDQSYGSRNFELSQMVDLVKCVVKAFPDHLVRLIPMHTYYIGGDDRIILERIKRLVNLNSVQVQHIPISLKSTMEVFSNAKFCVGMRFHSILLQTILNGKNFIIDYTDKDGGKIIGLIKQLNLEESFKGRYATTTWHDFDLSLVPSKVIVESETLNINMDEYIQL